MRAALFCILLTGCAAPRDYAMQFCTVKTDKGCHAWTIGKIKP